MSAAAPAQPRAALAQAFAPRLLLFAVAAGVLAGAAGVGFRLLLNGIQWIAFGSGCEMLVSALAGVPDWRIVAAPTLGGLLVGLYFRFLLPTRRPLGPADTIEAAVTGHALPLGKSLVGTMANALSLGVGASVGREGPVVLLGGALGAWLARCVRLNAAEARILLAGGVAACVAASFNAPVAAIVFALEAVLLRYALVPLPALALASAAGTLVSRLCLGSAPLFPLPAYTLHLGADLPGAAGLGIASAIVALALMAGIFATAGAAARVPGAPWLKTALAGLALGVIALWVPQVLSYGQESTHHAMEGRYGLTLLLLIAAAKLVATMISLGGGFGGGIFSPALVLGTAAGGAFGHAMSAIFPGATAAPGAYAAMGAAAMAAPILGAPISTALIVLEMTEAWNLWPAVVLAAVVATALCRPIAGHSFFTWQLARRGVIVASR